MVSVGMPSAERTELETRQRELVAALVAGGSPPAGLDAHRVRIQAAALVRKRGRSVARAEPELAAALGEEFGPAFARYAGDLTGPPPGCPAADAREFARYLRRPGRDGSRDVRRAAARVVPAWPLRLWHRTVAILPTRTRLAARQNGPIHPRF